MSSTILFSKPSSLALENGRLFGSLQTRSSVPLAAPRFVTRSRPTRNALRQPEDIERASFGRGILQIRHGVHEAQCSGAIANVEIARHDAARPAANPGQNGHILMAIRTPVGDGLADDSGLSLELPKQLASVGIDGFEPTLHGSVKH